MTGFIDTHAHYNDEKFTHRSGEASALNKDAGPGQSGGEGSSRAAAGIDAAGLGAAGLEAAGIDAAGLGAAGPFADELDAVLLRARESGLIAAINCAEDADTSEICIALAEKYDFIYAACGCHPHNASKVRPGDYERIYGLLKHQKAVAVGEAGLDYHYDFSPREAQWDCFRENIRLSKELDLPLVVHDREAHMDVMNILREEKAPEGRVVFHCYSGSAEMAELIAGQGWYFSVGGAVTFKNARRIVEALAVIPDELLMLETDCPYMTPEPFRGRRNDSSYVPLIAARIAEIKGVETGEIFGLTNANARRFFGI